MDEKKQIEEIYDIISDCCNNKSEDECIETMNCDECKAISLYNAGYRNCKDKVVLTSEEYDEIKQYQSYIPELKKAFDKIRKETVREIYREIIELSENPCNSREEIYSEVFGKYGVEVE